MADNRVWLVDDFAERRMFLAKGWGGGWEAWADESRLNRFFKPEDGIPADVSGSCGGKSTLRLLFEDAPRDDPAWSYEEVPPTTPYAVIKPDET